MVSKKQIIEKNGKTVVKFELAKNEVARLEDIKSEISRFQALLKLVVPEYVHARMILWDNMLHVSSEERYLFLKDHKMKLEEEIGLLHRQGYKTDEGIRRVNSIRGLIVDACLQPYAKFHKETKNERAGYNDAEQFLPESKHMDYSTVMTAMLHRKTIEQTVADYKERNTPFPIYPNEIWLFNPTIKRVNEAAEEFKRFLDYAKRNKGIIAECARLMSIYELNKEMADGNKTPISSQFALQEADKFLQKADQLFAHLKLPDFSRLEDKVLYSTNTSCY